MKQPPMSEQIISTTSPGVVAKAREVKLLALDVDGILTDGKLYFSGAGDAMKAFTTQDGLGIKLLQRAGIEVAIITGRRSSIVEKRAAELGITQLFQGDDEKIVCLKRLASQLNLEPNQLAFMGDDLPDLPPIIYSGLGATVPNAVPIVQHYADWQSSRPGGSGAVRLLCELILAAQGKLDSTYDALLEKV